MEAEKHTSVEGNTTSQDLEDSFGDSENNTRGPVDEECRRYIQQLVGSIDQ